MKIGIAVEQKGETMADLIDRQAAIDALCDEYCGGWQDCKYYPNCENLKSIEQLPSAQPEIIRCKDCRHWADNYVKTPSGKFVKNHYCSRGVTSAWSEWFCADGERRTDE